MDVPRVKGASRRELPPRRVLRLLRPEESEASLRGVGTLVTGSGRTVKGKSEVVLVFKPTLESDK